MLCYRCGSHVPDSTETCPGCGQVLGADQASVATFSRRKAPSAPVEGAPYRVGDVVGGRFRVDDIVGAGPIGFVFRARDSELDLEVALKVVSPRLAQTHEERARLVRALELGRRLSHQNILRVNEVAEEGGAVYFVTQFVDGLPLRRIIDLRQSRGHVFSVAEVEPILGQVAAALEAAHKLGAHGNVKPENVLIQPDLLKVTDFGLAPGLPRVPFVQAQKGRRADSYLAPEFTREGVLDARSDVYSMGVILGEMLTGLTPDGDVPDLRRVRRDLPFELEALYRKALNEHVGVRPWSPSELHGELARIAGAQPAQSGKPRLSTAQVSSAEELLREVVRPRSLELPPVADEHLPESSLVTPTPATVGGKHPRRGSAVGPNVVRMPHSDETQPMDMALLEAVVSSAERSVPSPGTGAPPPPPRADPPPLDATQPLDASELQRVAAKARAAAAEVVSGPPQPIVRVPPPPPEARSPGPAGAGLSRAQVPGENSATLALAMSELPLGGRGRQALFSAEVTPVSRPWVWLAALGILGIGAGLLGGLWLRDVLRSEAGGSGPPGLHAGSSPPRPSPAALAGALEAGGATVLPASASLPAPCPEGMRHIPPGRVELGTPAGDPSRGLHDRPTSRVTLGAFCVDAHEFPNRQGEAPRVAVSWSQARASCEGAGKRLCTEGEWERACKGSSGLRYPYGASFDPAACNTAEAGGRPRALGVAGGRPGCRSAFGVMDLSGNAAEWTASPLGAAGEMTQKGGAFDGDDHAVRCSARRGSPAASRSPRVGFRCCASPGR